MISALLASAMMFAQAAPSAVPTAPASPPHEVSGLTVPGKGKPAAKDPKEIVCHSEVVLGSLFPKNVCASREAIAERRREDQQQLRDWVALKPLKSN